jgi:propanediol dehydratase small subunit
MSGTRRGGTPDGAPGSDAQGGAGSEPFAPRALSGRPIEDLTLETAARGDLSPADLRIHPHTLRHQAAVAEAHGNPQLGENLRRAAELAALPDDAVLMVYEALRPGRSTAAGLESVAEHLTTAGAPLCAALVREAAEVYARRGLLKPG